MSQNFEIDKAQSQSSGTVGRSHTSAHGVTITLDASRRPQPDGVTNSEAFLGSVSSCGVTMIETRAQERKIPLRQTQVTIEGSRNPEIARYLSVQMKFVLSGVSQAEAQELIDFYKGNCPLYGTLAVAAQVTLEWSVAA
jgi:uncharacterized OsmC-like protein